MPKIKDSSTYPREGWQYPSVKGPPVKAPSYSQLYGRVKKHYEGTGREAPTKEVVDLYICEHLTVPCIEGTAMFRNKHSDPPTFLQRGLTGPDWPWMLMPLKLLAVPEDRGIGDIIERTIGPIGGDAFRKWYRAIFGQECGCQERQENWNLIYPL